MTTNKKGNASFASAGAADPAGVAVTATATDAKGNTSEFSDPKTVG